MTDRDVDVTVAGDRPARSWFAGEVRVVAVLLGCGLAAFAIERAVLLTFWGGRFAGVPWEERLQALLVGGRIDVSFLALVLLPVWFLLHAPRVHWARSRAVRVAIGTWLGTWTAVLTIGVVADVVHYDEVGARLDGRTLDDLGQPAVLVDALGNAPLLGVALVGLLALGGFAGFLVQRRLPALGPTAPRGRVRALLGVALLLLLGGAARLEGDITAWWGTAYFSEHHEANQLAINGPYSLLLALVADGHGSELLESVDGPTEAEALAVVLPQIAPGDVLAADPASPLWRLTDTGRERRDLNVVIVLLESFTARGIGTLGGRKGLSDAFDRLAEGGVLFTQLHAAGTRSNRGLAAVASGLPALPGRSPLRAAWVQNGMFTLGDVLRERGYTTHFLTGGSRHYDNLDAYALSNGFDRVIDQDDVVDPVFRTEWGVCDEDLYRTALESFDALHADTASRPFCGVLITVSSHRPYLFPQGRIEPVETPGRRGEVRNSLKYADWALGRFMDEAATRPWFDDTLFVFVADHGKDVRPVDGPDVESSRIPLLLYAPRVLDVPRRIADVASQVDVPTTVLGVLGGAYEHCFFGGDLLGAEPPRRASIVMGDTLLWREDDVVAAWVPGHDVAFYALLDGRPRRLRSDDVEPAVAARLTARVQAQARLAAALPRDARYRRPDRTDR